jgi:hypothetical protein
MNGKDKEGSGSGLISGTILAFMHRDRGKPRQNSDRTDDLPAEI